MQRLMMLFLLFASQVACGDDADSLGGDGAQEKSSDTGGGEDDEEAASDGADGSAGAGTDVGSEGDEDPSGCGMACELVTDPMCANGPPTVSLCVLLCESTLAGDNEVCRDAFEGVIGCIEPSTEFACDDAGDIVATGCEEEFDALRPCLPSL